MRSCAAFVNQAAGRWSRWCCSPERAATHCCRDSSPRRWRCSSSPARWFCSWRVSMLPIFSSHGPRRVGGARGAFGTGRAPIPTRQARAHRRRPHGWCRGPGSCLAHRAPQGSAASLIALYGRPVALSIPFDGRAIVVAALLSCAAALVIGLLSVELANSSAAIR